MDSCPFTCAMSRFSMQLFGLQHDPPPNQVARRHGEQQPSEIGPRGRAPCRLEPNGVQGACGGGQGVQPRAGFAGGGGDKGTATPKAWVFLSTPGGPGGFWEKRAGQTPWEWGVGCPWGDQPAGSWTRWQPPKKYHIQPNQHFQPKLGG